MKDRSKENGYNKTKNADFALEKEAIGRMVEITVNYNDNPMENELLHLLIESLPDQIYLKDVYSRFILCNTPVALNAGYNSPEDLIGRTDFDFHPNEATEFFSDEQSVMKSERPLINHEESFIDGKTKKVKWNLTTKVPVKDKAGHVIGLLGINRDITEMKKALYEREQTMASFIQRNKDLEQFTLIVSHNLRAPVANIIGLMELAGDLNNTDADNKQIWAGLAASIKNMNMVVDDLNQILEVRKEAGEKREIVYFKQLVADIEASINNILKREQVTFKYDFSQVAGMTCSSGCLFSIFFNLISNSIKFKRAGVNPSISIKSYAYDKYFKLVFKDNGRGIDLKQNGAQLFGLYKRFDIDVEGKGAGLFMVKTQVELLGGTIAVKSIRGKGTEFIIEFPQKEVV